ncbi:MAG: alpha/beta fold hydrolase [Sphingomonadaceae bacterium]
MDPTRVTPVLLPGNMCDARLWTAEVRDALPGAVDADLSFDTSIAAMAARALSTNAGPLLPVGFSMGAIVAVEMWVQAPERIAGLVLLGYNATADLPERAAHRPAQQAEVQAGGLERVLVDELKPNYVALENRGNTPLLELLRAMGMDLGAQVFVRQSEALRLRADRVETLPMLDVAVLYGCGTEDALCPPAWHRRWEALTTDARFAEFASAGHMLPLEAPQVLAATIAAWIDEKELT